jgi:hypothetical protein
MTTKRQSLKRPAQVHLSNEALDVFAEMRALDCTCGPPRTVKNSVCMTGSHVEYDNCPGCQRYDVLYGRLQHLLLGWVRAHDRTWDTFADKLLEHPDVENPWPVGSNMWSQWRPNVEAQGRWVELEDALAERERAIPRE